MVVIILVRFLVLLIFIMADSNLVKSKMGDVTAIVLARFFGYHSGKYFLSDDAIFYKCSRTLLEVVSRIAEL